jgi:pyridoxine 4-dehydrogenase
MMDGHGPLRSEGKREIGPFSVSAIGFGAMRLTGPNVFGPPENREAAKAVLRAAVELGVDHIDTAQYYGPVVVNELIKEALSPYPPQLVIVSKVGAARGPRGEIFADDEPSRLREGIEDNLRTLGASSLGVVNMRLMGSSGPDSRFDDQLGAMVAAREAGLIRAIGLSNVSLHHLVHARKFTEIACVQNAFNPVDRSSREVLDECTRLGIAFVPFGPIGFGATSVLGNPTLAEVARSVGCTPAQACLAWQLALAPNILLIPGTSTLSHLRENLRAGEVHLDRHAFDLISQM